MECILLFCVQICATIRNVSAEFYWFYYYVLFIKDAINNNKWNMRTQNEVIALVVDRQIHISAFIHSSACRGNLQMSQWFFIYIYIVVHWSVSMEMCSPFRDPCILLLL